MGKKKHTKPNKTARQKTRSFHPAFWIAIVLLVLLLLIFPLFMKIDALAYWDQGNGPFFLIFSREVLITGIWGIFCFLAGIFVFFGSFYMIATKKAFNAKALILPAFFLSLFSFLMAYGFLGTSISFHFASDAITYFKEGPAEQVIVLEDYEVERDYGRFRAPTQYHYTSSEGETFTTQTVFGIDLAEGEEYRIRYLPKSNYLVGIEKAD